MLKSYCKIAWRYLVKDRQFTLLNLIGLSTGLACALLIYMWVADELRVDKFHKNDARLYQVVENRKKANGIWTARTSAAPTADALAKAFPEVAYAVTTDPIWNSILSPDDSKNIRANGKYAGKDFFKLFSYNLVDGNADQVLASPNAIVLSDVLAKSLFGGTAGLIGKTVVFQHEQPFTVSGIYKDPGPHSSDRFDFVLPFEVLKQKEPSLDSWGNTGCYTFLTLKPGVDVVQFNTRIRDFIRQVTNNDITHRTTFLVRYSDSYLYDHYEDGVQSGGRIEYVRLFIIIALFILVIACINFMNLSTAKASERAREVGIKKTMGASRTTLLLQYLGESTLMAYASLLLAVLLVMLLLPGFNAVTGKQLAMTDFSTGVILAALGITLLTGLLAGSYPALYLSGFKPVQVLKGKLHNTLGELLIRKGLVVFQFTLSVVLIVAVFVVYKQISFIQTKNLGYNRDHLLSFQKEGKLKEEQQQDAFLKEARRLPGVVAASGMGHNLTGHNSGTYGVSWEGKDPRDHTEFEIMRADNDMLETLGIQLQEGRGFSRDFPGDTAKIIFNEAGIRFMGLKNPIGKTVNVWGKDLQIIGVAKDFHFESLHEKIKPLFFLLTPDDTYRFIVKIEAGKEKQVIEALQQLYAQFNPGFSFDYSFLDTDYQALYTAERRVSVLSRYFAGLAILISCLGLFGLAAFTAQRRSKEIGIRKVLGATVSMVVLMLSKDFLKLVLIALIIACPLAWWVLTNWLHGFAYRVPMSFSIFIVAGLLIILITFATISFQSVKAALANPVKSLKSE